MSQYYSFNVDYTQGGSSIAGDGAQKMAMKDVAKTAAKTTYDAASSGAKDRENNAIYDTGVRTYKVAAVASLAIGNHQEAALVHAYNKIDFNSAETKQYLNDMGYGTANRDILNAFKNDVYFEGQAKGDATGTKLMQASEGNSFYNKLLGNEGHFTQKVDGTEYSFIKNNYMIEVQRPLYSAPAANGTVAPPNKLYVSRQDIQNGYFTHQGQQISLVDGNWKTSSGMDLSNAKIRNVYASGDISVLNNNAVREQVRSESIIGASTKQQKIHALGVMNNASLDYLRSTNPELKNKLDLALTQGHTRGNQKAAIAQVRAGLLAELHAGKCTPARQAELQGMIKSLDVHGKVGGGNVIKNSKLDFMHRQGMRTIGREFLGDDMMKGIDFYTRTAAVTKHSVKALSHVTYKTTSYAAEGSLFIAEKVAKKIGWNGGEKFASRVRGGVKGHRDFYNARRRARRGGKESWKEFKKNQRLNKLDKKLARTNRKIARKKFKGRNAKALEKRAARLAKKQSKRMKKRVKKAIRDALKLAWEWMKANIKLAAQVAQLAGDIAKLANTISTAVGNVTGIVTGVLLVIKYSVYAIAIGLVLALIAYEVEMALVVVLSLLVSKLFSMPATDLTGALNNRNFNQYIVDMTCEELGGSFLETAQKDAQLHYLVHERIASDSLPWYKDTVEGTIGHIWAREECDNTTYESGALYYGDTYVQNTALRTELAGINANMVPIMAMMNERFYGEINFENYHNAMAYVYYMYVLSHDVAKYDSNDENWDTWDEGYSYRELDSHPYEEIYMGGSPEASDLWDVSSGTRLHPNENCTNVFIHGYTQELGGTLNGWKANALDFAKKAINFFEEKLGNGEDIIDLDINSVGSYIISDHNLIQCGNSSHTHVATCRFPADHPMAQCSNIVYSQYSTLKTNGVCCGIEEHVHSDANGCYSRHSGSWSCAHRCSVPDCLTMTFKPNPNGPGMISSYSYHCSHTCNTNEGCVYTPGNKYLSCSKDEHDHNDYPWNSLTDPGCWKSVAICAGHCGGHIQPVVNIAVTSTWEGLMREDVFKQTYFMTDSEFSPGIVSEITNEMNALLGTDISLELSDYSLNAWKLKWNNKMNMWFIPFPRGPVNLIQYVVKEGIWHGAELIDSVTGRLAGEDDTLTDAELESAMENAEDLYSFDGWWVGDNQLNTGLVKDLTDLNGTIEDKYQTGVDNWKYMDVVFPVGPNKAYSEGDIQEIIKAIKSNYTLSEQQEAIIKEALRSAGMYWYQDSNLANQNAIRNDCGSADPFGFVGGVLNRAGVTNYSVTSVSTWMNSGSKRPGSVLTMVNGDDSNVLIYLGCYTDPVSGKGGHWVVDCNGDANGSALRVITSPNEINAYTYCKTY